MKLPDKEFYTIQEVAKRWDCSENDVLHFIQMLRLLPSFYLEKVRCRVRKPPLDMESLEIAPVRTFTGLVSPLLFADDCCDKLLSVQRQWQSDLEESLLVAGAPTFYDDGENETLEVLSPLEVTPITFDDFLITLKELQRFEAEAAKQPETPESSATTSDTTNTQTAIDTDKELCDRLKLEGLNNKAIAKELKREFPQIRPAKIGRLITEVPGVYVEYETYRGRGRQLLK